MSVSNRRHQILDVSCRGARNSNGRRACRCPVCELIYFPLNFRRVNVDEYRAWPYSRCCGESRPCRIETHAIKRCRDFSEHLRAGQNIERSLLASSSICRAYSASYANRQIVVRNWRFEASTRWSSRGRLHGRCLHHPAIGRALERFGVGRRRSLLCLQSLLQLLTQFSLGLRWIRRPGSVQRRQGRHCRWTPGWFVPRV